MQLEHSFTVPVGVDDAWATLLDIEKIAPCMPGAAIDTVDGDDFTGSVKVRLGPIGLTYKGNASFTEKDVETHRAVILAQGKDARGNGTAKATVTATLTAKDGATVVDVITDLAITGKPAQFGRGVMVDVGNKLIGQFADCLAGKLGETDTEPDAARAPDTLPETAVAATPAADSVATAATEPVASAPIASVTTAGADDQGGAAGPADTVDATVTPTPKPAVSRPAPRPDVEPIDLLGSAGPAVAKRLAPVLGVILAVVVFVVLRRRKS